LTPNQIASGLHRTIKKGGAFPPSLPEFLLSCRGGDHSFEMTYEACNYWSNDDELKRRGITKTRELLFIMQKIGGDLYSNHTERARRDIVKKGIDMLNAHIQRGGELPEMPIAEIEHEQLPKVGFCLSEFERLMEGGK